jgi:serine/threonine-protein kinase
LYELLTGKTPFDGETPVEIAMKHLSNAPKPPSKLRPDVPPELDMVVLRALAKNPDDRYQSADEMEADLDRVARGAKVAAATVDTATQVMRRPPAAAAVESATAATMIAPPPSTRTRVAPAAVVEEEEIEEDRGGPERPMWPWLVAAAFVIAAAIAGFFVWHELAGSGKTQEPVKLYVNEPVAQARNQIAAAHLHAKVLHGSSKRYRQGIVFKQDPGPGSKVDKGGTVTIWVSTGPPKVQVPDVKGEQWAQAEAALHNAHLNPVKFGVPGATKGKVTATDPPAGKSVPEGTKVRVNVMTGPALGTVPGVVGLSLNDATAKLEAAGFTATTSFVQSNAPQNTVVAQSPQPGSELAKGKGVKLSVSSGPPQVTVTSVIGYTAQQAVQTLEGEGFLVTQQYRTVNDPNQDGVVQEQNPPGGTKADKGSTVTIVVGQFSQGPPTTTTTGQG